MQQPVTLQWWLRSGRGTLHLRQKVALPGAHRAEAEAVDKAEPTSWTKLCQAKGKRPGSSMEARK